MSGLPRGGAWPGTGCAVRLANMATNESDETTSIDSQGGALPALPRTGAVAYPVDRERMLRWAETGEGCFDDVVQHDRAPLTHDDIFGPDGMAAQMAVELNIPAEGERGIVKAIPAAQTEALAQDDGADGQ